MTKITFYEDLGSLVSVYPAPADHFAPVHSNLTKFCLNFQCLSRNVSGNVDREMSCETLSFI